VSKAHSLIATCFGVRAVLVRGSKCVMYFLNHGVSLSQRGYSFHFKKPYRKLSTSGKGRRFRLCPEETSVLEPNEWVFSR
jgi:hypothetical protein